MFKTLTKNIISSLSITLFLFNIPLMKPYGISELNSLSDITSLLYKLQEVFFKDDVVKSIPLNLSLVLIFFIAISMGVIFSINPIGSLMFLILTYVLSSIVLIVYGLEFMGLLLVIVYVGAVAVLFLFVIMMLKFEKVSEYKINKVSSLFFKLLFFTFILFYSFAFYSLCSEEFLLHLKKDYFSPHHIGPDIYNNLFLSEKETNEVFLANILARDWSSFDQTLSKGYFNINDRLFNDLEVLGLYFYTEFSYIFLLCGVILLVSIVAPILLTFKGSSKNKMQKSSEQINTYKKKSIFLKDL